MYFIYFYVLYITLHFILIRKNKKKYTLNFNKIFITTIILCAQHHLINKYKFVLKLTHIVLYLN